MAKHLIFYCRSNAFLTVVLLCSFSLRTLANKWIYTDTITVETYWNQTKYLATVEEKLEIENTSSVNDTAGIRIPKNNNISNAPNILIGEGYKYTKKERIIQMRDSKGYLIKNIKSKYCQIVSRKVSSLNKNLEIVHSPGNKSTYSLPTSGRTITTDSGCLQLSKENQLSASSIELTNTSEITNSVNNQIVLKTQVTSKFSLEIWIAIFSSIFIPIILVLLNMVKNRRLSS